MKPNKFSRKQKINLIQLVLEQTIVRLTANELNLFPFVKRCSGICEVIKALLFEGAITNDERIWLIKQLKKEGARIGLNIHNCYLWEETKIKPRVDFLMRLYKKQKGKQHKEQAAERKARKKAIRKRSAC